MRQNLSLQTVGLQRLSNLIQVRRRSCVELDAAIRVLRMRRAMLDSGLSCVNFPQK